MNMCATKTAWDGVALSVKRSHLPKLTLAHCEMRYLVLNMRVLNCQAVYFSCFSRTGFPGR